MTVRSVCGVSVTLTAEPRALEKIEISFLRCQIGADLLCLCPQAHSQTVDRENARFGRVTPQKMREHVWQFQGYWAAWRLKAENYVVFPGTAFPRSVRFDDECVRSLDAYLDIYFRGKCEMSARKKKPKLKCHVLREKFEPFPFSLWYFMTIWQIALQNNSSRSSSIQRWLLKSYFSRTLCIRKRLHTQRASNVTNRMNRKYL